MALYDDPIEAARRRMFPQQTNRSFFPAVNQRLFDDRSDLLKDADAMFYGGGNAPPTPTPTPTPRPRSYFGFNLNPLFQTPSTTSNPYRPTPTPTPTPNFGLGMNRNNPWEEWQQKYGFGF